MGNARFCPSTVLMVFEIGSPWTLWVQVYWLGSALELESWALQDRPCWKFLMEGLGFSV